MNRSMTPLVLALIIISILSVNTISVHALSDQEVQALADIFASAPKILTSFGWSPNVSSACDTNSTFSSTLACSDGHVTGVDFLLGFTSNVATMPLIPAWGNLTHLVSLIMAGVPLTGTIPASIGQLSNLTLLNLAFNQLSGTIPDFAGTNLLVLDLSHNLLSGSISPGLLGLPKLTGINLGFNDLNGTLPSYVSFSSVFEQMTLSYNYLSGSIPSTWTNFQRPTLLALDNNRLTGTIPSNLFESNILLFDVINNRLDVCSGALHPPPHNLDACAILPQFYHMTHCNCSSKWKKVCGDIPETCPDCLSPRPSPEFHCSDFYGWFADSVNVGPSQIVDFAATSQSTPAIILDSLVVQGSGIIKFGMDSAISTYGTVDIQGTVQISLTQDNTVYLSNQLGGQYLEKKWNAVTRTYISQVGSPQSINWVPSVSLPNICNQVNVTTKTPFNGAPWNSAYYQVTYQYTSAVKFRCSPWVIVLSVFGGVILLTLVVVLGCIVYTRWQKKRGEERHPLLHLQ